MTAMLAGNGINPAITLTDTFDMDAGREIPTRTEENTGAAQGQDRRRSTRETVVTLGMVRALTHDDAPAEQVLVTNVSLHGVGFRSSRKPALGSRWGIEIGVGPLHLTSRMHIVRALPREDGMYDVGAEFC